MRLAEKKTGRKKSPKIGHLRTTAHLSGCIFAAKACIDNRKNLPQQISTGFAFWLHYCSDVVHRRPTKLCTIFVRLLGCYTLCTHLLGLLPPDGILPAAKFTLRPSLAFSYIGSVTARHANSGRQPNFVAWYNEWNYGTFAEGATYVRLGGHDVGHWPTF